MELNYERLNKDIDKYIDVSKEIIDILADKGLSYKEMMVVLKCLESNLLLWESYQWKDAVENMEKLRCDRK